MGFPRRPAAWHRPQAETRTVAGVAASTEKQRGWASDVEDLAYVAVGAGSLALLVYCFWQMSLSVS